jgi:hypothetical protein
MDQVIEPLLQLLLVHTAVTHTVHHCMHTQQQQQQQHQQQLLLPDCAAARALSSRDSNSRAL